MIVPDELPQALMVTPMEKFIQFKGLKIDLLWGFIMGDG
jgi:hypothetical protein